MIFCKNNIYDRKLKNVAANVSIQSENLTVSEKEKELLVNFLNTVIAEIDINAKSRFEIIFPISHIDIISQLDEINQKKVAIKISKNDTFKVESLDNKLVFKLENVKEIKVIPKGTDFIMIHNDNIDEFEPHLENLNKNYNVIVINISTHEQLNKLMDLGVQYFEGHFIETPKKVEQSQIPANKITVLNLISILNDPDTELYDLSEIITTDNLLSYKLLRIVNSPIFRGVNEIKSIHEAIIRFGFANLKKWVLMLSLCNMSDKPLALVELTLQRAVMCHLLAQSKELDVKPEVCYTVGLLSTLDAFVDHPMESLLLDTPLVDEIKNAILYYQGSIGEVLKKVINYQRADEVNKEDDMTKIYIEAAKEVKDIFNTLKINT